MRSEATSNDYAVTADVLRDVLDTYTSIGKFFDYFCCLYPTAPFVTADKLVKAFQKMKETGADALNRYSTGNSQLNAFHHAKYFILNRQYY